MNCFRPKRIRNRYTDEYMYVPCRECDACRINYANQKTIQLANDIKQYSKCWLVTLDYDNYSVPFVVPGMQNIFRYAEYKRVQAGVNWVHSDFPIMIDDLSYDESKSIEKLEKPKVLRKHFVSDAIGVLYYKDIQNFFKRLNKELTKNGIVNYRKFAVGEYGSRRQRPHFHFVLYSNNSRITHELLRNAVIKCWPFKDWYKFGVFEDESFKRCDAKTAGYIASYVNGSLCSNGVQSIKRFRQKTIRSKNIAFGVADQSKEKIIDFIQGRFDKDISERGGHIFEIFDYSKIDRVSTCPVQSRYFLAFFPRFKGYGKVTPGSFASRARRIYYMFNSEFREELIACEWLSSMDIAFMRGFERWKKYYQYKMEDWRLFDNYLIQHDKASRLYNSLCLEYEMKQFEVLGSNYFLTKINTYAENLEKRQRKISAYMHKEVFSIDINKPPHIIRKLHQKCNQYYYKLLPKHLNDY